MLPGPEPPDLEGNPYLNLCSIGLLFVNSISTLIS